jgi:hypothetical protein
VLAMAYRTLIIVFLFLFAISLKAQEKIISGIITDARQNNR